MLKILEDQISNPEKLEYSQKDIEGLLNRLIFNRDIQSIKRDGKNFYFY